VLWIEKGQIRMIKGRR